MGRGGLHREAVEGCRHAGASRYVAPEADAERDRLLPLPEAVETGAARQQCGSQRRTGAGGKERG